jgi:hypothetical protein
MIRSRFRFYPGSPEAVSQGLQWAQHSHWSLHTDVRIATFRRPTPARCGAFADK